MRLFNYITFLITVSVYSLGANPVDIFELPLISEFQSKDSIHWTIEIGGNGFSHYIVQAPCTTSSMRLRINSSGKLYSTKVYFDNDGIALLTRSSVIGIPQQENIKINNFDTIQILYTRSNDSIIAGWWNFVVLPTKPGNSLVNCSDGIHPYETTRPSIGSKGNYTTTHQIVCVDQQNVPIPGVEISGWITTVNKPGRLVNFGYTDSSGSFCCITISKKCSERQSDTNYFLQASNYKMIRGANLLYIDTLLNLTDTVFFERSSSEIKKSNVYTRSVPYQFIVHNYPNYGISFCVVTSTPISNDAKVMVYSLSGKELACLKMPVTAPGTYSAVWNGINFQSQKCTFNKYLCKFVVNGKAVSSKVIVLSK